MSNEKKEPLLRVEDLIVEYTSGGKIIHAVNGVSFDLEEGTTIGLVGETGAGKTSIAKAILRVLPDPPAKIKSGSIYLNGEDILKTPEEKMLDIRGDKISMIFQDPMTALNPTMTIGDQIAEVIELHSDISKREAHHRAVKMLRKVGITEERYSEFPFQFSGGMKQRVVIAIALACDPDLLICDEPTTALDVTIQAKILELIRSIQKERGISVIYITHDLGVVAKVADYVDVMYAGKIVETGTIDEIFYEPRHPYTWGLLSAMPDLDTADDRLYTIPGSPPNLLHEKPGDAFAPRNHFALNIDDEVDPPMFKITDTHYAATWLLDPRAPKVDMPPELAQRIARMKAEAKKIEEAE